MEGESFKIIKEYSFWSPL